MAVQSFFRQKLIGTGTGYGTYPRQWTDEYPNSSVSDLSHLCGYCFSGSGSGFPDPGVTKRRKIWYTKIQFTDVVLAVVSLSASLNAELDP